MSPITVIHTLATQRAIRKAVFLDRDGVIIENSDTYVLTERDIDPFAGVRTAATRLVDAGFALIVVTNQACIGRGLIGLDEALRLHSMALRLLGIEDLVLASIICPHHPDQGCTCRKPLTGMLDVAAERFSIDLQSSYLIGDALTDIEAGIEAGATAILVRTGRGTRQEVLVKERYPAFDHVVADIGEAADLVLGDQKRP